MRVRSCSSVVATVVATALATTAGLVAGTIFVVGGAVSAGAATTYSAGAAPSHSAGAAPSNSAGAVTAPSGWYQSGQNQSRSGFNPGEATLTSSNVARLHQVWTHSTAVPCCRSFLGQVVAANGLAYYASGDSQFTAVTIATGTVRWRASVADCGNSAAPPSIHLGVLVVATSQCSPDDFTSELAGYDASTGRALWAWPSVEFMSAPVTVDGTAYVLSRDQDSAERVDAIDVRTGALRWEVRPAAFVSQLAADGSHLYLSGADQVQSRSTVTGHLLWTRFVPGGQVLQSAGHVVFAGYSGGQRVVSAFTASGARQWQIRRSGSRSYFIAATADELLLAGGSTVQASTLATGATRWTRTVSGTIFDQPAIAGGVVYATTVTDSGANVYALREGTGGRLWSRAYSSFTDTVSASVAAGTLFVSRDGAGVVALRP
jgi:outer membrane protein assembly factor BamB